MIVFSLRINPRRIHSCNSVTGFIRITLLFVLLKHVHVLLSTFAVDNEAHKLVIVRLSSLENQLCNPFRNS